MTLGSDISCLFDSTPEFTEVSGRRCLVEGLARRVITPRGQLIDDLNYGYDVTVWVNAEVTPLDIAQITSSVEQEWEKDERVLSANVKVQFVQDAIIITGVVTDGQGPFTLVLAVSDVTVQLLTVGR